MLAFDEPFGRVGIESVLYICMINDGENVDFERAILRPVNTIQYIVDNNVAKLGCRNVLKNYNGIF